MKIGSTLAALGCGFVASMAQAAPVLDQSSVPETGLFPVNGSVGTGVNNGPSVSMGQTFTAGLTGQLTRIDLAIFSSPFFDPAGPLTVAVKTLAGDILATQQIDVSTLPDLTFGVTWVQIPQFDFSAGDVLVTAGLEYKILVTGPASTGSFWIYQINDAPLAYADGHAFGVFQGSEGGPLPFDFGFRTYVDTAAVPEPGTWALLILGFGGAGVALRGRRRAGATA
jgi:hypothetical protein